MHLGYLLRLGTVTSKASMMSLSKSFFDLTKYMSEDPEYGEFWNVIYSEYVTTKRLLLKLTGMTSSKN